MDDSFPSWTLFGKEGCVCVYCICLYECLLLLSSRDTHTHTHTHTMSCYAICFGHAMERLVGMPCVCCAIDRWRKFTRIWYVHATWFLHAATTTQEHMYVHGERGKCIFSRDIFATLSLSLSLSLEVHLLPSWDNTWKRCWRVYVCVVGVVVVVEV